MSQRRSEGGKKAGGSRRRKAREEEEEEEEMEIETEGLSRTQKTAKKTVEGMDAQLRERKVAEVLRYLIFADRKKAPIRKKELVDKVLGEYSRAFPVIFEKANAKLQEVFGLEAKEIQKGSVMFYVLRSLIPAEKRDALIDWSKRDSLQTGLLAVILSIIMMKQGQIAEDQLWAFLTRLGMTPDKDHPQFGKSVLKGLVDQLYLLQEKRLAGEQHVHWYKWGPRAEVEVDREKLLEFVADIHGGDLEMWKRQFKEVLQANSQA